MSAYELYINGSKTDLNENDSKILLTLQRTDYSNPTIVRNSYSKSVKLPGTQNNNKLFDGIYRPEKVQGVSGFNPSKRVPFKLYNDGNLVEAGYIKLDKIDRSGVYNTYDITLYGELGTILYKLTYDYDNPLNESLKLTLGDLPYEYDLGFEINRNVILDAWNRLDNLDSGDSKYDTINFCVSYNGSPGFDGFDSKKAIVRTSDWNLISTGERYSIDNKPSWSLPTSNEDGASVFYVNSDEDNPTAVLEMSDSVSDLDMRDFRSYLQRPVIRVKKVFEAISRYMENKLGYTLDLSDPFFSTSEFKDSWITLSMLYELNPYVETGTVFTQEDLLSNTSDPASYLISYCKTYGIYIDVDIYDKKIILRRTERFYQGNRREVIDIDTDGFSINPLSFDKNNYTFDWAEGDSIDQKTYKDTYNIQYGSKRVRTGLEFNADSEQYIANNVFRNGLDSIETSNYFRTGNLPAPLLPINSTCKYTLFKGLGTGDVSSSSVDITGVDQKIYGYYSESKDWGGMKPMTFQDQFPKLQCHGENNSPSDGKDILVLFNGTREPKICYYDGSSFWTPTSKDYIPKYIVSDDIPEVKEVLGKNCWTIWNGSQSSPYDYFLEKITRIPSFSRSRYNFDSSYSNRKYRITSTLDFGENRELYMASTDYQLTDGYAPVIYNRYWRKLISDIYNVNTRVATGRVVFPNINDAFRKIYHFENCYWILVKITDYDYDSKLSTAEFLKVNNINNFSDYVKIIPDLLEVSSKGGVYTIYIEGLSDGVSITSDSSWVHLGAVENGKCTVTVDPYDYERRGTITATSQGYTDTIVINQVVYREETGTVTINALPDSSTIILI